MNIFLFLFLTLKKNKKNGSINKFDILKMCIVSPLLLLAHPAEFIFLAVLLFSFVFFTKTKNRIFVLLIFVSTAILDAFFLIPYFENKKYFYLGHYIGLSQNMFTIDFSLLGHIIFIATSLYFFAKKRNHIFIPFTILAIMNIFGLSSFIPIINQPMNCQYNIIFLILTAYMILTNTYKINYNLKFLLITALVISNLFSFFNVLSYTDKTNIFDTKYAELFTFSSNINGTLMGLFEDNKSPSEYYSFLAYNVILFNLTTVDFWFTQQTPTELFDVKNNIFEHFKNGNCSAAINFSKNINISYFISDIPYCQKLENCNIKIVDRTSNFCLLKI